MLVVEDLEALRLVLGLDTLGDAEFWSTYTLDGAILQMISERFGVEIDADGRECWLSRAHSIRKIPYLVHTGYELALMLDGVKPLARFSVEYPTKPDDWVPDSLFGPHVQSGALVRFTADEPYNQPMPIRNGRLFAGVRWIFYARHGEEWRIDAHLLIWRQLKHGPWNETLERLDGSLLGYTEAQNDWWGDNRRLAVSSWTGSTVYVALSDAELVFLRAVGEKALPPDATLRLMMYGTRPKPAKLEQWMATSGAAAIVRFGLADAFLSNREHEDTNGTLCYLISREEIPALNRALASPIKVIAERAVAKEASRIA